MTLSLRLFGTPAVAFGDATDMLRSERRGQLAAVLALKRTWVPRAELAALLWPGQDSRLAQTNLRKALFRLQALPWAQRVEVRADALRFEVTTDVADFEAALRERRLADALRLRRGELLAGFDDPANDAWTSWLRFERDRLRVAWRAAAQELLAAAPEPVAGADLAARLLEDDPFDEEALRAYIACLSRSGQAARARDAYRDFAARLDKELGLAPGAETRALVEAIAAPAAATGALPPPADDGFVGRAIELRRITALLAQDDCRLLCLTGPGGVGKTRLARRVAQELGPGFDGGAAFVPLDDLTAAGELGVRLARELDIALQGRADPLAQVIDALRRRRALLVLDNFEQLVDAAPQLDRLLAQCPRLKAVVTSRTRLGLASEWLLPLEGLPCPEQEDLDHVESFDAARLFVRRARRVQPDFDAAGEAAAIVDICRQVEGLPLALELAATWTRVLTCEAIAQELRQGTELLHAAAGAAASRHAGIEVVFEQSWRLLAEPERRVLARLSVFHGSFSTEAARAVAQAPLPVLRALVDKSLLHRDGDRLRLHPLVQQSAAQRLDAATAESTRSAHAAFFRDLLARLRRASEDGERAALETIDAEFENCRQAWRHAVAAGDAAALRRSAPALLNHVEHRARFADGLELFQQAAGSPLAATDVALQATMLGEAALMQQRLGRYAEAEAGARQVMQLLSDHADEPARYRALSVLATCAVMTGRLDDAGQLYRQALALAQAAGRVRDVAGALENLSLVEKRKGNYDEALRLAHDALAQHRRIGDHAALALSLSNLGSFDMFLNRNEAAAEHLQEALALSEQHGLVSTRAYVLANLTELALKSKDAAAARAHAERALQIAEATGMRQLEGWLRIQLSRLAAWRGDADAARDLLAAGTGLALSLQAPSLKAAALMAFADLLAQSGQAPVAASVLAFAKDEPAISVPDREELAAALARCSVSPDRAAPWPGMALDELLHGIATEAASSHQRLIARLRGLP